MMKAVLSRATGKNSQAIRRESNARCSILMVMPVEDNWITSLKALADKSRLRIMAALLRRSCSVNELGQILSASQYNVSKHLRILKDAGLVEMKTNKNRHEYFIAASFRRHLAKNRNVLDLGCCVFRFDRLPKK